MFESDSLFAVSSEEKSRLAARKYARIIQKLGFPVSSEYFGLIILGLCSMRTLTPGPFHGVQDPEHGR